MSGVTYLALDIGEKRIGVAVGTIVPFGRGWIAVTTVEDTLQALDRIIKHEGVMHIVVGLPKVASGDATPQIARVHALVTELRKRFDLPVEMVDETLTSREAERQLREEGVDTAREKGRIDERSAQLILAQYLEEHGDRHA